MDRPLRSLLRRASAALCLGFCAAAMVAGCNQNPKPKAPEPKYKDLPPKEVPSFMEKTVFQNADLGNTDPYPISSYGLVIGLANTGDTTAPTAVREYMLKEMAKHGFGSRTMGLERQSPETVLRDRSVAIVEVVGMLPPGVRKYQNFDVYVSCLSGNQTTSLAGGKLFLAELRKDGANPRNPFGAVNVFGQAKGFIFVNPAYALNHEPAPRGPARASLRSGVILDGGVALFDRPLFLRLRQPSFRLSRTIEQRLVERFQDVHIAQAEDEGVVQIYVPQSYKGDWQHFAQLAMHVYLESSPEFEAAKAQRLVQEAMKPDAPLEDISYCWEGMGSSALPYLAPLIADHGTRPDVAFAAARSAAYIGDPTGAAMSALMLIARSPDHPFQLNAVQALGGLPASGSISHALRELLDSEKTQVRIEAYKILARNHDAIINSQVVTESEDHQKFVLDVVPTRGRPLIFATSSGTPRLAIIGAMPEVATPVMFSAMENRLTISSTNVGNALTIFYRPPAPKSDNAYLDVRTPEPVHMVSSTDLAQVIKRLGGWLTVDDDRPLDFTYSEVLAILQRLSDEHRLVSYQEGQMTWAPFVLQDMPRLVPNLATPAPDTGRPQGEAKATPTGRAG
jgi:hypothetical protein